jgi:hypothetical protein
VIKEEIIMAITIKKKVVQIACAANDNEPGATQPEASGTPLSKGKYVVMNPSQFSELPTSLTTGEAGERLKHCEKWVRQQLKALQIPILKVGSRILVPEAHLALFYSTGSERSPRAQLPKKGR